MYAQEIAGAFQRAYRHPAGSSQQYEPEAGAGFGSAGDTTVPPVPSVASGITLPTQEALREEWDQRRSLPVCGVGAVSQGTRRIASTPRRQSVIE